jgi:hypothetical protein
MNPDDHDVIMTLSALRTKLKFRWHRYTFALIKIDTASSTCSRDLTTQRSCRRTRFRSTRGTPRIGTTYRILPITRMPRLPA